MNIVAFIPARGGSKGIPHKNIKLLGNKPLLSYSIESAFMAGLSRVIVNTDDSEIADIAKQYGAEVMYVPPLIAKQRGIHQDKSSMYEVLKSEVPRIKPAPDLVLLLQPTTPFRKTSHINIASSMLSKNLENYDSIISVEKVPDKYNPAVVIVDGISGKKMAIGKIKSWFGKTENVLSGVPISQRITRRQDNPQAWIPTGSIYLFKAENLKKGSIYGERVMLLETESTINLNSQEDWDLAEKWITKK